MLLLEAVARGEWYEGVRRVRDAVDECGFVFEEHPFSGVMTSFRIEIHRERLSAFAQALDAHGVMLDDASRERLRAADVTVDAVPAMLAVRFPDGDPERRDEIPSVDG